MGANHLEEIRYLTGLVSPDVGLVNNAGPAHLEGFGDLEGVARGKGELFEVLSEDATAVVNADDAYADYWLGLLQGQSRILFGSIAGADVRADLDADRFVLEATGEKLEISLALPGRHNRMNALAAAAVALATGVGLDQIRAGLEALQPVGGRLNIHAGLNGSTIIDDTYNANPASFMAGIEVLAARQGKRILVMGDMGELGARTAELHEEVGTFARQQELDLLMGVGVNAAGAVSVFGRGGRHFDGKAELIADLRQELAADVTALVKGSRAMAMEEVVAAVTLDRESNGEGREHAA
jgi:UDP-N-acetylmuramoyl-tripeptide--D-alanyl-D-alanine ligase